MIGLIALVVAATAPAAPPPATGVPPTAVTSPRGAAALKALGISDAGIQVLRLQGQPDPDAKALMDRRLMLRARVAAAANATPFNLEALTAALRESATMEQTIRQRGEEKIVTMLKALPAADRPIFAKAVFAAPPRAPAPAPKP